ncbi:4'-phosphopantetheinyl transferase superfamily protein [Streptomyces sp. Je 1-79]|uniref:4'-phosphopantetheinyl transferase family protein n=1 Tax=Streptomyces sp. Je 1-79 TaxID=2943847 RepID=UPI0021A2F783|nr:4'-phosphopantetheinyl transferase superfamily protein [Streptomyces sp. Je 1-79]MCT4351880.1 4'-phosphopantetheinyl transferase superfamily protein [Streptomyces sp. Je 1-79]
MLHATELTPEVWQRPGEPLRPGESPHVWFAWTDALHDLAGAPADLVLDAEEQARGAAFRQKDDRAGHRSAHVALRLLLGARLGVEPSQVPLVRDPCPLCGAPHGRPAVRGSPLHFSLSRSGGCCLIALAATPVGVDVERIPDPATAREAGAVLHPRERIELAACPAEARPAAFTRAWARTEAYLKALGTGLGRGPDRDYLGTSSRGPAPMAGWAITDVAVPTACAAAVAVVQDPAG